MPKYICKYRKDKKNRQITFTATNRAMAIIGLYSCKNIHSKDIISLNKTTKS